MRTIMFVSNAFTHDPRVYAEAKSLVQAGYGVTVIAWDRESKEPTSQNVEGIEVLRLRTKLRVRHGVASVLWNAFNLLLWQRQAYRQALELNKRQASNVIHCHDLDTLGIGTKLKQRLGVPLIYDAHEIYGYMMARRLPHRIVNMFLWLEKRLVRKVDKIITVTGSVERYFSQITDKPISVIMNCKPLQGLEYQPPDNDKFTLLYIGSLHNGRGVPMLVRAARALSGVQCMTGGIGYPTYIQALKEECSKTSNVTFLGKVPFEEVIPMTMKADCVFLMVNPGDLNNRLGLGNKQFEAMVCGRPIICTKGTYSGELTEQEEVGLTAEYTKDALKEAIIKLRDDPKLREELGRNALKAAIAKYNWQAEERKLLNLYDNIACGRSGFEK